MKLITAVSVLALAAAAALFFQNQNLIDRMNVLERRIQTMGTSQPAPSADREVAGRVNALSTCLAQLHAQVVTLWNAETLPPDGRYCKRHFYGLGPRIGD